MPSRRTRKLIEDRRKRMELKLTFHEDGVRRRFKEEVGREPNEEDMAKIREYIDFNIEDQIYNLVDEGIEEVICGEEEEDKEEE